ncbi:MAG: hypothetical protein RXR41_04110 [Candidatus Marsarchaeota archaeon]
MRQAFLLLFVVVAAIFFGIAIAQQAGQQPVLYSSNVTVYADGTTIVDQHWYVFTPRAFLQLNGSTPSSFILVYGLNSSGRPYPLPYNYSAGGIYVDSEGYLVVGVTFSSSAMTSKSGEVWTVSWDYDVPTYAILPRGAVLLGWSVSPAKVSADNGSITVLMPSGPAYLNYTILQQPGYVLGTVSVPAQVLVNGRQVAQGTSFNLTLLPGIYTVTVAAPGYFPKNLTIAVQPGSVQVLKEVKLRSELAKVTSLTLSPTSVTEGGTVTLSATALSYFNAPMAGQEINFIVNGTLVGSNTTNSNGVAVFKYVPSKTGSLSVIASSATNSSVTSGAATLTVTPPTTVNYVLYAALVIAVIALGAGFGVYYVRLRRGKPQEPTADLDPEEKMIIDYLRAHDRKAFQSELLAALPIPKTTLWRNVMSLQEKGYVKVEKIGGQNLVTLNRRRSAWPMFRNVFSSSFKKSLSFSSATLAPLAFLCPPPLPPTAVAASWAKRPRSPSKSAEQRNDTWIEPSSSLLYATATSTGRDCIIRLAALPGKKST